MANLMTLLIRRFVGASSVEQSVIADARKIVGADPRTFLTLRFIRYVNTLDNTLAAIADTEKIVTPLPSAIINTATCSIRRWVNADETKFAVFETKKIVGNDLRTFLEMQFCRYVDARAPEVFQVGDIIKLVGLTVQMKSFRAYVQRRILSAGFDFTAQSIIPELRQRIRDESKTEYPEDSSLVVYINDAITFLNSYLLKINSAVMIKEAIVTDNGLIPKGFVRTCGQYPISRAGNHIRLYEGDELQVRYFAAKARVSSLENIIDFPVQYASVLSQVAAMFALNRTEFDISQDKGLLNDILTAGGGSS